jgi:hypothetical protein
MPDIEIKSAKQEPLASAPASRVFAIIFDSVTEAFGSAFVIWILGGVAISIADSFAGDMIPSSPPGFSGEHLNANHAHIRTWWEAVRGNAFGLFFVIFFMHSLWAGFHGKGGGPGKRAQRIVSNLRENWFELIVSNAITAWGAALMLGFAQNFSVIQMFSHWIWEMVAPVFRQIGGTTPGPLYSHTLADWFSWYDANQMKLAFWFIYLAGAFDDLGVPNYKTLARWVWRRIQKRKAMTIPASAKPGATV